jgi:hypothetical protein
VTGSAALLVQGFGDRSPAEIKSLLMNYAETEIWNGAPDAPINANLAAIQRIGAGEVRVDRSVAGADLAAWDSEALTGALSFGFVDGSQDTDVTREVTVANYGGAPQTLTITPSFRFENDETNGAVQVFAPPSVVVPAADVDGPGTATFDVTLTIEAGLLRDWTASSGGDGNDPGPLNVLEYDGYVELGNESVDPLHLAWHVLPRQSGETTSSDDTVEITGKTEGLPSGEAMLYNVGQNNSQIEGYSLVGESSQLPAGDAGQNLPTVDLRYAGVQTIPVPGNFCSANPSFLLLLAVNTWERQTHANAPASFEWDIDTDSDGAADFAVFNMDLAGDLTDGRNAVFVLDLNDEDALPFPTFFTDHATNSANTVLTICAEDIGLTGEDFFTPLTADLLAVDTYFAGRVTDQILGIEFAPLGERYFPLIDGAPGAGSVPATGSAELIALDFGVTDTNPSETGMLLFTDGTFGVGPGVFAKTGSPQANEALAIHVTDVLPFDDIRGTNFADDIVWALENGITTGCDPHLYCPKDPTTRGQMATFLDRALDLPDTDEDFFNDDNGIVHEDAINRIAAAGITTGCDPHKFCPKDPVTRGQMATFLDRAFDFADTDEDFFNDDNGIVHEGAINRIAAAGVTTGCDPHKYCPKAIVNRGQMAAFLHRAMGD